MLILVSKEDIKDVLDIIDDIEHFITIEHNLDEALKNIGDLQNFFESELEDDQ